MNISEQTIIGDLVAQDYRTASVFKNMGIDFCCNGNRSIADACLAKSLDTQTVLTSLKEINNQQNNSTTDYTSWPLDLLADYIEKKHHRYVRTKTEEILPYLHKIVKVHGERHPELLEVEKLFQESAEDLAEHMEKEEKDLFPLIRKMVETQQSGEKIQSSNETLKSPIATMMKEHDVEGRRFEKISELTDDYTPPSDACNTYRITFALLKEFEQDLHLHIHLENNILFPKSMKAEENLLTI
ncbi:MAG: iron-sulfur cluster repair di-iron protein [Chitinophagales bacterium]|nr:iron-sulfur cluster repair di-iron protein [Chitinophagales bacterium]